MNQNIDYKEILLVNPITFDSVKILFEKIDLCKSEFLIINTGNHEFESIEVLKELKNKFYQRSKDLLKFKKISFIHPSKYANQSLEIERYNFFYKKEEAINWLNI